MKNSSFFHRSNSSTPFWIIAASTLIVASLLVFVVSFSNNKMSTTSQQENAAQNRGGVFPVDEKKSSRTHEATQKKHNEKKNETVRVAFLGNSILYFNDCPRLVQQMLERRYEKVVQNSCLRGGATFKSLWREGNGMAKKFATAPARLENDSFDIGAPTVQDLLHQEHWDYVVMNDYTQGPARSDSRHASLDVLEEKYAKALAHSPKVIPIFVQTWAYKFRGVKGSDDLGDVDEFSDRLETGYQKYADHLRPLIPSGEVRIARVGEAFRWLYHHNRDLWENLYSWDDFHPSPHGTWLEACIIYIAMTKTAPPSYHSSWWNQSRVMQPADEKPLLRPTASEAAELRRIACKVMGIEAEDEDGQGNHHTRSEL